MIVLEWLFLIIAPYDAVEPWQLGSQDATTPMMQGIIDLHHDIFFFLILILVFLSRILVRALWYVQKDKNPISQRIVHGTTIEILQTIFPSTIPMFTAIPSFALLYSMDEVVVNPAITIKAIRHQWYRSAPLHEGDLSATKCLKNMKWGVEMVRPIPRNSPSIEAYGSILLLLELRNYWAGKGQPLVPAPLSSLWGWRSYSSRLASLSTAHLSNKEDDYRIEFAFHGELVIPYLLPVSYVQNQGGVALPSANPAISEPVFLIPFNGGDGMQKKALSFKGRVAWLRPRSHCWLGFALEATAYASLGFAIAHNWATKLEHTAMPPVFIWGESPAEERAVGPCNSSEIVMEQKQIWSDIPLFPVLVMFFISCLAETNRAPFDLLKAEAESVAGYNVKQTPSLDEHGLSQVEPGCAAGCSDRKEISRAMPEEMFLVDAGLATARMSMQDAPKGVPINRATRFENKDEYCDVLTAAVKRGRECEMLAEKKRIEAGHWPIFLLIWELSSLIAGSTSAILHYFWESVADLLMKDALGKLKNGYPLIPFTVRRKKHSEMGRVNTCLILLERDQGRDTFIPRSNSESNTSENKKDKQCLVNKILSGNKALQRLFD
ncbi:cytochrome c oxidase subunit 2 [Tanacetum coccineum]